jgi:hypothetical protein
MPFQLAVAELPANTEEGVTPSVVPVTLKLALVARRV